MMGDKNVTELKLTLKKFPVQAVMGSISDKKDLKKFVVVRLFSYPLKSKGYNYDYKNMILKAILKRRAGEISMIEFSTKVRAETMH
jgi:hypothetical protein